MSFCVLLKSNWTRSHSFRCFVAQCPTETPPSSTFQNLCVMLGPMLTCECCSCGLKHHSKDKNRTNVCAPTRNCKPGHGYPLNDHRSCGFGQLECLQIHIVTSHGCIQSILIKANRRFVTILSWILCTEKLNVNVIWRTGLERLFLRKD